MLNVLSEDDQQLFTSSFSDSWTRLYDLSGNELAAFKGRFQELQ
jgi:hypothetical protein